MRAAANRAPRASGRAYTRSTPTYPPAAAQSQTGRLETGGDRRPEPGGDWRSETGGDRGRQETRDVELPSRASCLLSPVSSLLSPLSCLLSPDPAGTMPAPLVCCPAPLPDGQTRSLGS